MTDKELLELAAKAAGYQIHIGQLYNGMESLFIGKPKQVMEDPDPIEWNPLTDDGDALRLAVKLATQSEPGNGLNIFLHHDESVVYGPGEGFLHKHGNDPYRATRRAIVRAAAEIGKAMP